MPAIYGQRHLITWWRGQRPTRHRWPGWLGDTGGFWGGTQDFKYHCCMLLVPAEEMRTTNSHALLPHPQGVFLGLLHSKPVHRSAVQHPVYKVLDPTPVILPDELQCFGTVGPVYSGLLAGGRVLGYILGVLRGGWRWHGSAHQGLLHGFQGYQVWGWGGRVRRAPVSRRQGRDRGRLWRLWGARLS